MNTLDADIINIVNNWKNNIDDIGESEHIKYEYSKNKFRNKYAARTGEFLKITKKLESLLFSKICHGLSNNYEFTEKLLDEYLEWCFENYDFFSKKYKAFNLTNIADFAPEWTKDFLNYKCDNNKHIISDLDNIDVSKNVLSFCEKYGIPITITKLINDHGINKEKFINVFNNKLQELTNTKDGLNKLRNILRKTVENSPYSDDYLFCDYKKTLSKYLKYFTSEPWS
jgi:hypothetical protein